MKKASPLDEELLRRLLENSDESATVAMFLQLYRESPELRHWLREDYARDPQLRDQVEFVSKGKHQVARFAELTSDYRSWREERSQLRANHSGILYGGLSWREMTTLIGHYQAGPLDLGVYLLVSRWRKAGKSTPAIRWAGAALLESVVPSGRRRMLKHLNEALAFTKKFEDKMKRQSVLGYADWWKLQTLLYILRYPKDSYRTRELRSHLSKLGLEISTKDLRRFCTRHKIRRDMRAGRPRKRSGAVSNE